MRRRGFNPGRGAREADGKGARGRGRAGALRCPEDAEAGRFIKDKQRKRRKKRAREKGREGQRKRERERESPHVVGPQPMSAIPCVKAVRDCRPSR